MTCRCTYMYIVNVYRARMTLVTENGRFRRSLGSSYNPYIKQESSEGSRSIPKNRDSAALSTGLFHIITL